MKNLRYSVIARHRNWAYGAVVQEMHAWDAEDNLYIRFSASVRGWNGFYLYQGKAQKGLAEKIQAEVVAIREKIDAGDDAVFTDQRYYRKNAWPE